MKSGHEAATKPLMKKRLRGGLLFGALGIAAVATVVSGREDPASEVQTQASASQPRIVPSTASRTEIAAVDLDLTRLQRAPRAEPIAELFPALDAPSNAPHGPKKKNEKPAAPPEPPLPFKYLGKVIDEGKLSVFLTNGTVHYIVQPGQTVDSQYRVDQVSDSSVTFTYLPTGSRQVLVIPSVSASSVGAPSPSAANVNTQNENAPNSNVPNMNVPNISTEGGGPPRAAAPANPSAAYATSATVPGAN